MSSVVHLCLVCQSGFDPDDEVLRAVHTSFERVGGEDVSRKETRYAHVDACDDYVTLGSEAKGSRGGQAKSRKARTTS